MHEALYYEKLTGGNVHCHLCPHECVIAPGTAGLCKVRRNENGALYSLVYGEYTSLNLDPVEKKPLYHFHPGSQILSIGTFGCNFRCEFCQNWRISQELCDSRTVLPGELIDLARSRSAVGIAYTYNEPSIWLEFVVECAREARAAGLVNAVVTNGYIMPEPLDELLGCVDAMNIDLKSFRDAFYQELCGGRLQPVLDTIKTAAARTHVELTTLIIPEQNDDPAEWAEAAQWIAHECSPDMPVHLSAFTPRHRLKTRPTPPAVLKEAQAVYRKHLNYVYMGNVVTDGGADTRCPGCGEVVVKRTGYDAEVRHFENGRCALCSGRIPLIMS